MYKINLDECDDFINPLMGLTKDQIIERAALEATDPGHDRFRFVLDLDTKKMILFENGKRDASELNAYKDYYCNAVYSSEPAPQYQSFSKREPVSDFIKD